MHSFKCLIKSYLRSESCELSTASVPKNIRDSSSNDDSNEAENFAGKIIAEWPSVANLFIEHRS